MANADTFNKSTTVRTIVSSLSLVGKVWPGAAARAGSALFFKAPPRRTLTPVQRARLEDAEPLQIAMGGTKLQAWRWGQGPRVVLVHGWGGWGAQLHAFVQPLVQAGYEVVAYDGPGHGQSPGRQSSIPVLSATLMAVEAQLGPIQAVVAHSLGTAAAIHALHSGLAAQRLVAIAGPAHPVRWYSEWMQNFVDHATYTRELRRIERSFGLQFDDLDPVLTATSRTEPLLWIHDVDDREVPHAAGEEVVAAWPEARMHTTRGLGHRRILEDPEVVRLAVAFVCEPDPVSSSGC